MEEIRNNWSSLLHTADYELEDKFGVSRDEVRYAIMKFRTQLQPLEEYLTLLAAERSSRINPNE